MVNPLCPRCGYDLSGPVASWTDTCPLHGVCSECGLAVRWAELLNPLLTVPRWSFEHAPIERAGRRLVGTWWRALGPRRFWRALRLEHPVILGRLPAFGLVMLLGVHIVVFAGTLWLRHSSPWASRWGRGPSLIDAARGAVWPYTLEDPIDLFTGKMLRLDGEYLVGTPHMFLFTWYLLTPASFLLLGETFRNVRVRREHLVRAMAYSLTPLPLIAWLNGVAVAAAAVGGARPSHRITMDLNGLFVALPSLVLLAGAVWLVWFWWVVPREYLRLPHAGPVGLVLVGTSGLAVATLFAVAAWAMMKM